jgi:hypothetical protein
VIAFNVFTNSAAATYSLSATPGELALDSANGLLYVTLDSASFLAKVNLNTGVVTNIALSAPAIHLAVANGGYVFAALDYNYSWPDLKVAYINGVSASVANYFTFSSYVFNAYVAYDKVGNHLYLAADGCSGCNFTQYSFNAGTTVLSGLVTAPGFVQNVEDMMTSLDGLHIAVPDGGGNGSGYNIWDYSATNITTSFGSWNTGAYPSSAGFSTDSLHVVTSNAADVMVFNVSNHALSKQWTSVFSGFPMVRTRFSVGGNYVYVLRGSPSAPTSFFWGSYP